MEIAEITYDKELRMLTTNQQPSFPPEMDNLTSVPFLITGNPVNVDSMIIGALVERLGGQVELTNLELLKVFGVSFCSNTDGNLIIETNSIPI